MKQAYSILILEPLSLWLRGWRSMALNARTIAVWVAVLAAVVLDGTSTYLLLHPRQNGTYSEGNPGAALVMDLVGLNGWVFVGNVMCLIVLPAVMAAKPLTQFQRLLWWGGAVTILGKIASGSWNGYLYWATG